VGLRICLGAVESRKISPLLVIEPRFLDHPARKPAAIPTGWPASLAVGGLREYRVIFVLHSNITWVISSKNMKWAEYTLRMGEMRNTSKFLIGKSEGKECDCIRKKNGS
jgi:hypothetical protein